MATPSGVGRPRRSSKRTLEEAAAELFLEQGYAGTTVDQISSRAGVSRNTFFNYFGSKADLLWVDFDETVASLADELDRSTDADPIDELGLAVLRVAASYPEAQVPWAVTQLELMGTRDELESSGLARFMAQASVVERYLLARMPPGTPPLTPRAIAYAVLAATVAAIGAWASAGVSRGDLVDYVRDAIIPVCAGFREAQRE